MSSCSRPSDLLFCEPRGARAHNQRVNRRCLSSVALTAFDLQERRPGLSFLPVPDGLSLLFETVQCPAEDPGHLARTRLAATVAAGGRLLDESADRWRVADPEGNEMVIASGA